MDILPFIKKENTLQNTISSGSFFQGHSQDSRILSRSEMCPGEFWMLSSFRQWETFNLIWQSADKLKHWNQVGLELWALQNIKKTRTNSPTYIESVLVLRVMIGLGTFNLGLHSGVLFEWVLFWSPLGILTVKGSI